jgi:FkbM family methyltransferase
MFLYNLIDKFLMRDFTELIIKNLKTKKPVIFDVGCYIGNFSTNLQKRLNLKKNSFYLFDANPNLKVKNFKYYNEVFSNKIQMKNFYLNEFLPSSGSSLETDVKNDLKWNFTRRIMSLSFKKKFKSFKIKTNTLDNFCKENKIKKIDILKIDVEGSELKVLEGSKKILDKTNIIQVEILQNKKNFDKIKKKITILLKKYNFHKISEKNIYSVRLFSNLKSSDLLFIKL